MQTACKTSTARVTAAPTRAPRCARRPICAPAPGVSRFSAPEISSKSAQLCSLAIWLPNYKFFVIYKLLYKVLLTPGFVLYVPT